MAKITPFSNPVWRNAVGQLAVAALLWAMPRVTAAADCNGSALTGLPGAPRAWQLQDGGIAAFGKMNINIDGYARAYHPQNSQAGALIHLCNAGRVFLADGGRYEGSESNATCTGKFMADVARIRNAGWNDASVGAVNWYGVLGKGSVRIGGTKVDAVEPVVNRDGSGFYVSPTSLFDTTLSDVADQSRYVNPLRIAAGVVPRLLIARGVAMGSFGVAIHVDTRVAVPFVVGDGGPRIGEGTPALARRVAGLAASDDITRANRFTGQVDAAKVLWVFFADTPAPFDSRNENRTISAAAEAFARWGGDDRLANCLSTVPRN